MWRIMLCVVAVLLLIGSGTAALFAHAETRSEHRQRAQERWDMQALTDYRIAVQVTMLGNDCFQELEVRGGKLNATIRDTCDSAWLGKLTVERLFSLSRRSEGQSYCYPASSLCACQRMNIGTVDFHPELGYPQFLDQRREVRPNLANTDYWILSWRSRSLGICRPMPQHLHVAVISLVPLR